LQGSDPLKIVANLTHELKTPLHAIISTASLLSSQIDGQLNQEQKKQVDIILRNSENLLEMISSLLSFSSTLTSSRLLTVLKINPKKFFKEIFQNFEPIALKKGITFGFQSTIASDYFYTDKELLTRVISNLLSNAIKFTNSKGSVDFAVTDEGQAGIRIQIADSGLGMDPEDKAQVFNAFYQADSSSTREYSGVGLGLSLVKNAIEQIDAKISLESELNQGTIFTIDIPNLKDKYKQPLIYLSGVDEALRPSLTLVLEEEGFILDYLEFDKIVKKISNSIPDLLIIDGVNSFSDIDKVTALKSIKNLEIIPVLALLNLQDSKLRAKLIDTGVSEVISKPFDVSEILARIRLLLLK
jgi:CheY-like chemotaxis protein